MSSCGNGTGGSSTLLSLSSGIGLLDLTGLWSICLILFRKQFQEVNEEKVERKVEGERVFVGQKYKIPTVRVREKGLI